MGKMLWFENQESIRKLLPEKPNRKSRKKFEESIQAHLGVSVCSVDNQCMFQYDGLNVVIEYRDNDRKMRVFCKGLTLETAQIKNATIEELKLELYWLWGLSAEELALAYTTKAFSQDVIRYIIAATSKNKE